MANHHKSHKVIASDYDKPWKEFVRRRLGKFVKCLICRPKKGKYKRAQMKREYRNLCVE